MGYEDVEKCSRVEMHFSYEEKLILEWDDGQELFSVCVYIWCNYSVVCSLSVVRWRECVEHDKYVDSVVCLTNTKSPSTGFQGDVW